MRPRLLGVSALALTWALSSPVGAAPSTGGEIPPPPVYRPPKKAKPVEQGEDLGLERHDDGGYVYEDPHGRFTAHFAPDGTVNFGDRWRKPSADNAQRGSCCALPLGGINPLVGMPITGPAEWLLRWSGQDILARAKHDLLERTRELRTAMAIEFTRVQIEKRLAELDTDLDLLWTSDRSAAERRALLFQRWDECIELFDIAPEGIPAEAASEIDHERVKAATHARRKIEAFIRGRLPRGSTRAYSPDELRKLNAQRESQAQFAPYAKPDERRP